MSTVKNGQYNEGALAGRFALRDLTNSGKFTNIINVIPYRYQVTISGSSLSVAAGSTFTVLDGLSEADLTPYNIYPKITEELTVSSGSLINSSTQPASDPTQFQYLVYNPDAQRLELGTIDDFTYHAEAIPDEDIEANTFINAYGQKVSLPIGYLDDQNTWHPFHSIGFFGRLAWVDVGVDCLCPAGRDDKGGLNVARTEIVEVVFTEFSDSELNTYTNGTLLMNTDGILSAAATFLSSTSRESIDEGYNFVSEENYIYDHLGYLYNGCKLCTINMTNGVFIDMSSFNTYAPANFNEISDRITAVDESALHCTGREDITENAYGTKHFHDEVIFDNATIVGGSLENVEITTPFVVQCPEITTDFTNLTNLSPSAAYNGVYGGLCVKYDAYITSVGDPALNPNLANHLQIVGSTECGKAGISLGNKQTVRLMGDSAESNLYVTLGTGGSILPNATANNKYSIGSNNSKFLAMYATNFYGTASQTYWADLAEKYITDKEYPAGTIVAWGGEKELTIATEKTAPEDIAGVISENPGVLMNADGEGQPLAVAGRVKVRVIGTVKKHDQLMLCDDGRAISKRDVLDGGNLRESFVECVKTRPVIGRALEDKEDRDEGLVLCAVRFNI